MGFYMTLLMMRPQNYDFAYLHSSLGKRLERKCVLYENETIIKVGRVSSPTSEELFLQKTARERAALRFANCFFAAFNKYVSRAGTDCLAPPFAILKDTKQGGLSTHHDWQYQFRTSRRSNNHFIRPSVSGGFISSQIPAQKLMEEHNAALKGCKGHHKTTDIIMAKPLVHVPCSLMADWIRASESKPETVSWFKPDDTEAIAIANIWKSCIFELAGSGCEYYVLFLFENLHLPEIL